MEPWKTQTHPNWLLVGAVCFGTVIGWITRYILAFAKEVSINSLATIIGALGGAAITGIFDTKGGAFGHYSVGLAVGFFLHVLLYDIDSDTGEVRYHLSLQNPVKGKGDVEAAPQLQNDQARLSRR